MSAEAQDVFSLIGDSDGFSEELSAYVTVYAINQHQLSMEIEYVDMDNDEEVIQTRRFTITVEED
jgi:hypothetical protein